MNKRGLIISCLVCIFVVSTYPAVVFVDLGYTMVAPSTRQAFSHLGFWPTIRGILSFSHGNPARMVQFSAYFRHFYMHTLHHIPSPCHSRPNYRSRLPDGTAMPAIMQDFLTGAIDSNHALHHINQWANGHCRYFKNSTQKLLFLRTAHFNFSRHAFVNSLYLLPCAALIKRCKERGHTCIIVSNWAKDHINPFKVKFARTIMPYIDACVFSCDGYGPKPQVGIYNRCTEIIRKRFPKQLKQPWVMIDDQPEHLHGARTYFHHKSLFCTTPHNAAHLLCHLRLA